MIAANKNQAGMHIKMKKSAKSIVTVIDAVNCTPESFIAGIAFRYSRYHIKPIGINSNTADMIK